MVPTYNVGAYLDEFLSSVVRQSTGLENVEIIIVDDGATDQSGAIARRWQSCYPDAITYIHQENQDFPPPAIPGSRMPRATG
ncbi:glycosyltransferase [Thauera sp. SDU_THAU2]|uniref:glycosyltransferase n=1 Tax=Thauera sp. SDU_THAU2 TaxID=3136633 RepID=UPI00311E6D27